MINFRVKELYQLMPVKPIGYNRLRTTGLISPFAGKGRFTPAFY
jgi:hypothetical protein